MPAAFGTDEKKIRNIRCSDCAWQCASDPDKGIYGSQIDLVIDRNDRVVNLCEMKYFDLDYRITKDYDRKLKGKISDFKYVTGTKSTVKLKKLRIFTCA